MNEHTLYIVRASLIAALGGFLMGFDASVISGVVPFIEPEFSLTKIELGWAVASLTLTATLAMMVAGPVSDRYGRLPVLKLAAVIFAASAIWSAIAPDFAALLAARMLGGLAVGAALIVAPIYIAEIAPARLRGRLVSFNQLNIVVGISAAFFSNYLIVSLGHSDRAWVQSLRLEEWNWRWMLGIETLPAIFYYFALLVVPESPRWLVMRGRDEEAIAIMTRVSGVEGARSDLQAVKHSLAAEAGKQSASVSELFKPAMKLVMLVGVAVAILQQITGINAVFFYAPMIFEQSGIGKDAAFMQAVLVGLVNLVFTLVAITLIDRLGRRPLLGLGLAGIACCMLLLSYGFGSATYTLGGDSIASLPPDIERSALEPVVGRTYGSDVEFRGAMISAVGAETYQSHQSEFVSASIEINPAIIIIGILGFVASFAMSLGPVMWVLFSELFPNRIRGIAISFVGLINSATSFFVQLVFPWELENIGNSTTFLIYGVFAIAGLVVVMYLLPETKGRSLEELESELVGGPRG